MKARFLALAAFLFGACAEHHGAPLPPIPEPPPGCERTFVVSPAFLPEERDALERAVTRWNRVAIEQFCLTDGTGEAIEHGIFRIEYGGTYWKGLSAYFGGANILGVHFGESDQIGIVDTLGMDTFELVALHELGHAHGLAHTPPPSIMAASVGSASDFTSIDMGECRRVGACDGGDSDPLSFAPPPKIQVVFR